MKNIIVFVQLICLADFVQAQQNNQIDNLKQALLSSKDDLKRIVILDSLGSAYLWSVPDTALLYAQQQLLLAKKINSQKWEARALGNYGGSLYVLGNYPLALDYSLQSLRLAEKLNDTSRLIYACFALSSIYGDIGDNSHALYYSYKATRVSEKFNNKSWLPESLIITGGIYKQANQLDSALALTQRGYKLDSLYNGKHTLAYAPHVLGDINYKKGFYTLALDYYRLAVALSKQQNDIATLMGVYNGMSKTFIKTRQVDSAIFYSNQTLLAGKSTAYPLGMLNAYAALSGIYKSQDNTDSSVKYNELTASIRDSIFNKERVTQFQNLSFSEKLRKQDIEAAQIQYQNKVKVYTLLGGFAVLLLLAGMLWRNNKTKQRANILLQKQKEEIATQKLKVEQSLQELELAQAQLIQSEKMASLGELTAGIAHEIQNPLNFINNFSEVSKELVEEIKQETDKGNSREVKIIADDVLANLEKVVHHGKRADAIVKGMLQHSRASTGKTEPTDINALADEYLRLSFHGLRVKDKYFDATITTHFDESIGKIEVAPQDIGRVLLNLYNNAFYSVNEKKKRLQQQDLTDYEPTVSVSTKKGHGKVEISVRDNGTGISQKVVGKIFQPFFTTKPTGEGTGLGLSLSYDIINKGHGGELKVDSKEGEYTTMVIHLPLQH
jgi:signal transduction histidine kinase